MTIACSDSSSSLKYVGCPLRSKQNLLRAGGVGVSAKGYSFGSRSLGSGGGFNKRGGKVVVVVVVVVTIVVVVVGASEIVAAVGSLYAESAGGGVTSEAVFSWGGNGIEVDTGVEGL